MQMLSNVMSHAKRYRFRCLLSEKGGWLNGRRGSRHGSYAHFFRPFRFCTTKRIMPGRGGCTWVIFWNGIRNCRCWVGRGLATFWIRRGSYAALRVGNSSNWGDLFLKWKLDSSSLAWAFYDTISAALRGMCYCYVQGGSSNWEHLQIF